MPQDTSYTPEEVAQILKISRFTVYEMIKRGDLPAYRIGRKFRVESADLEHYKQAGKERSSLEPGSAVAVESAQLPTRFVICGQDVVLDVLTRHMERQLPGFGFFRNYVGSIEGLLALYRGQADAATAHLWDSDTNDYNAPYVRRLLPGQRTLLINLVYRQAGFYVAKGNPLGLNAWKDLSRPGLIIVNREPGSGARVLLDEQLHCLDIDGRSLTGYNQEELSHLAVASRVARGEAHVGVGVEKTALQVENIDFVPLQMERYDLVIRHSDLEKPQYQVLLSVLRSAAFAREISGLGGYGIQDMGKVMAEF